VLDFANDKLNDDKTYYTGTTEEIRIVLFQCLMWQHEILPPDSISLVTWNALVVRIRFPGGLDGGDGAS
jgi:hypothetical protein